MLWDPNTVFRRKDGSQVIFSQLSGKRVMLFVERLYDNSFNSENYPKVKFLKMLRERYLEMKGTDDEFEVIHLVESKNNMYHKNVYPELESFAKIKTESGAIKHIGDMPWLVSFASKFLHAEFVSHLCYQPDYFGRDSSIFVFDREGRLVRRTIYPTFEDSDFPFYAGGLEEECLSQLIRYRGWNYWEYYRNRGRIYSYTNKLAVKS